MGAGYTTRPARGHKVGGRAPVANNDNPIPARATISSLRSTGTIPSKALICAAGGPGRLRSLAFSHRPSVPKVLKRHKSTSVKPASLRARSKPRHE